MNILNIKKTEKDKWGCGCAVINKENKLLLGLRCKKNDLPQWCFVGGSIELNETPLEGVKREIKEESNLSPIDVEFIESFELNNVKDFIFICKNFEGLEKPQEGELKELKWFTKEELNHLDLFPYTIDAIKLLEKHNII